MQETNERTQEAERIAAEQERLAQLYKMSPTLAAVAANSFMMAFEMLRPAA